MKSVFSLLLLLLLTACSGRQPLLLPELTELNGIDSTQTRKLEQRCAAKFVAGRWQFVHSIAFEMAAGGGATVIGVTVLDGPTLKCALLGVEGFVLFEAVLDQTLEVSRALPPFDNPEFARGLMRDVQTIFLPPAEKPALSGLLVGGDSVCRYFGEDGQVIDILFHEDGSSGMNIYGPDLNRTRSIVAGPPLSVAAEMIPKTLELTASGLRGYTLTMTLISAEKI
ncbi:MAG: DUF3261 domain-containing protein [Proteobacteria bacterium]|nr:DUF3261 domain-containing protein [Pseudomonadota bacterium]MBU1059159.1 DUF3261 domain-containing protein [Pseudomonadota bacterium]